MFGCERLITTHFLKWKVILLVNTERNTVAWHSIKNYPPYCRIGAKDLNFLRHYVLNWQSSKI